MIDGFTVSNWFKNHELACEMKKNRIPIDIQRKVISWYKASKALGFESFSWKLQTNFIPSSKFLSQKDEKDFFVSSKILKKFLNMSSGLFVYDVMSFW